MNKVLERYRKEFMEEDFTEEIVLNQIEADKLSDEEIKEFGRSSY